MNTCIKNMLRELTRIKRLIHREEISLSSYRRLKKGAKQ